jgi:hypothetical protein
MQCELVNGWFEHIQEPCIVMGIIDWGGDKREESGRQYKQDFTDGGVRTGRVDVVSGGGY